MRGAAILVCAFLLASCGPDAEVPPETSPHWTVEGEPRRTWGLGSRQGLQLVLPQARHARRLPRDAPRTLVVNLLRDGGMRVKGEVWRLRGSGPEERRAALDHVRDDLRHLPLLVHADRHALWMDVTTILRSSQEPPGRKTAWQLAVLPPRAAFDAVLQGPLLLPGTADDSVSLRLSTERVSPTEATVTLYVEEKPFTFGTIGGISTYEDPEFLHRANAVWRDVEAHLEATVREGRSATLSVSGLAPDVLWVVKVMDLLLGARVREIAFPDADLRLALDLPDDAPQEEPSRALTAAMVFWVATLVLVALAVTLLPLLARRRKDRS